MKFNNLFQTDRLELALLTVDEAPFLFELVNTPGWLRYIGDRKVSTLEEAIVYTQKIMDNTNILYWVVRLRVSSAPIGIISFIQRDYLEHPDIGFAFLPGYAKQGYAFEAVTVVLDHLRKDPDHPVILATTLKGNIPSIRLLEKLGLRLEREIEREKEVVLLYTTAAK